MGKTRHRDPLDVIGRIIIYMLAVFAIAIALSPFLFWYLDCRSGGDFLSPGYMVLGVIGLVFTTVVVDTMVEARKREKREEQELVEQAEKLVKWAEDFKREYAKYDREPRGRALKGRGPARRK